MNMRRKHTDSNPSVRVCETSGAGPLLVSGHPGRSYYNSLNQLVIEIERTEDREIEHNFEYGRPICFFTADISGKFKYLDFSATISYVQEDRWW